MRSAAALLALLALATAAAAAPVHTNRKLRKGCVERRRPLCAATLPPKYHRLSPSHPLCRPIQHEPLAPGCQ